MVEVLQHNTPNSTSTVKKIPTIAGVNILMSSEDKQLYN